MDLPQMIDFIDWKIHFFDFAILGACRSTASATSTRSASATHARPKTARSRHGRHQRSVRPVAALLHRDDAARPRRFRDRGRLHLRRRPPRRRHLAHRSRPAGGRTEAGDDAARRVRFRTGEQGDARQVAACRVSRSRGPRKGTGFDLVIDGTPTVTSMPTEEELLVLRENVDSTGVLRERRRRKARNKKLQGKDPMYLTEEHTAFARQMQENGRTACRADCRPRSTRAIAFQKSWFRFSATWACCSSGCRKNMAARAAT